VLVHRDHTLIAVLGFPKIDDFRQEIKLADAQGEQFVHAPAVGVSSLK
jgi:hypothetical protein